MDSVLGSGRSPGGGHRNPLQYSCLENPMDRGAWQATVHRSQRVRHNWSNWAHIHFGSSAGKESACNVGDPGSIPGLGRSPGEGIDYPLQYSWASLVAQTVKNLLAIWEIWIWSLGWEDPPGEGNGKPTLVFLLGEFQGQRSLAVYSPRDHKELDTTEWLSLRFILFKIRRADIKIWNSSFMFRCQETWHSWALFLLGNNQL